MGLTVLGVLAIHILNVVQERISLLNMAFQLMSELDTVTMELPDHQKQADGQHRTDLVGRVPYVLQRAFLLPAN